jgi:tetratricopeptide (TPR) repeat protein
VEASREALALLQPVLQNHPNYKRIRERVAKSSVLLGEHLALAGSLEEAETHIEEGIRRYEALVAKDSRPDLIRDLASSHLRRAWASTLRGDLASAKIAYDLARSAVAQLAKADAGNAMTQSDLVGIDLHRGELLVLSGQYASARTMLQSTLASFLKLEGDANVISEESIYTWLGEAQFGLHNFAGALQSYQKAMGLLEKHLEWDDNRCGWAADAVRAAATLLKLGRPNDAGDMYHKALATADTTLARAHQDPPSLYPIADAYSGLADIALVRTNRKEACEFYQKSAQTWKQIAQPALINPADYPAGNPRSVDQRIAAECKTPQPSH